MASNTSRPEGLRKIGSTAEDGVNRVSILDYFNLDRGVATFRGIEGGNGITVTLMDADGSPNTSGSIIRITGSGMGGGSGEAGSIWFTGEGAPASGLGAETDLYLNTLNGQYYQKGTTVWVLKGTLAGPTGAAGAQGVAGPKGDTGAAGVAGPAGPKGDTGAAGADGADGVAGPAGAKGDIGATGPQGIQGIAGPQGPIGPAGADGAAGIQGPAGADGVAGPAGADGAAGSTGPVGPQGEIGPQGIQGVAGPKGDKGDKGDTGADGSSFAVKGSRDDVADLPATGNVNGDAYLVDGDMYVWNDTQFDNAGPLQGPAGPQGTQGEVGPQGPQGEAGPQGIQGVQGPAGLDGATGPQGTAGATGPAGADGAQGPAGPAGADGVAGPAGPQGPAGADGAAGAKGDKGDTGATGAAGAKGDAGAGVTAGGTTGQILAKKSNTDFDTQWIAAPTGGTVTAVDSSTVDFSGQGTSGVPLTAAVRVSTLVAGNLITTQSDGLHVAATPAAITVADTQSIDLSGTGLSGSPLTAAAIISPTAGNTLSSTAQGLYVPTVTTTSSDTATIDFSGAGTSASPLTADVKRSSLVANNRITAQSDGIHVAPVGVQKAGTVVSANPTAINFTGTNITVTEVAGVATVAVAGGGAPVQEEGTQVVAAPTAINFVGEGVTATNVGGVATITIPGGSGSGSGGLTVYTFRIDFPSSGAPTISNLPTGWTSSFNTSGNILTITHNLGKRYTYVIANGFNTTFGGYVQRFPSAAMDWYQNTPNNVAEVRNVSASGFGTAAGSHSLVEFHVM